MSTLADVEVCRLQEEVQSLRYENAVMRRHFNLHPSMPLGDDLRQKLVDTAAFLDELAERLDSWQSVVRFGFAADDCRKRAQELRGEPPSRNPYGEGDPAEIDGT